MKRRLIALTIALLAIGGAFASCATGEKTDEPSTEATAEAQSPTESTGDDRKTGQSAESAESADDQKGYDARLTSYDYPFEVKTHSFEAQDESLEMAYMDVEADDPNGRTVVLLHGKNFSGAYWGRTMKALKKRGYRVIAPDQVGFGKSSKPVDLQYSFHALATYTKNLLDKLGVDKATVVGHSMGGMLATRFALMHPDFTEKLALVNPIGLEDWKRKAPYLTVDEWYEREMQKTPAKIKAYMKKNYFDGTWKEAYDPLVEIQAGWTQGPDWKKLARVSARTYDMIFTQPVLYEFPDLQMPTLLIIGQRDRTALGKGLVSDKVASTMGRYNKLDEKTAEAIPDSTLVELDDIGHIPHYEAWDRYRQSLTEFVSD